MTNKKFRAWDHFNDCFWYSTDYKTLARFFEVIQNLYEDHPIILDQYVEREDDAGTPIFENHIIRVKDARDDDGYSNFKVLYDWRGAGIVVDREGNLPIHIRLDMLSEVMVVGNDHQNTK